MNEKSIQSEASRFFDERGWAKKNVDAIRCKRCGFIVVEHTDKGAADLVAFTRGGEAVAVEIKADPSERFAFNRIDKEQWTWLSDHPTNAHVWFWIQIGVRLGDRIAPRSVFLLPRVVLANVRRLMNELGGVDNLPLNERAARTRIATRENNLNAKYLLKPYELVWFQDGWIALDDHPFVIQYGE